jgi:hypothetical protein
MRLFAVCLLFVAAAGAVGCSGKLSGLDQPRRGESRAGPVTDYASLVANLRAAGASVKPGEEVDQPFFSVTGKMIEVHGEDVQVFQYADAAVADAQAAQISPTGTTVGTTKIHWIGPPHFFKKGRLIVLYVGDNGKVLKALEAVLGRRFAGR